MTDQRCAACGSTTDLTLLTTQVAGCATCIAQLLDRLERDGGGG